MNLPNQTSQTKPSKPNLPNLPNRPNRTFQTSQTKPTKPNFFKTNLSKIVNWRVILNDHIRKKSYAGNYTIYGYLLSNVKIKWRILPTTKICWNPLLIPRLFPESNLYCALLPLNLILHPNGNGNNSDLWPSVVIGTLTIFNQWNKNWCQRKRDVEKPIFRSRYFTFQRSYLNLI